MGRNPEARAARTRHHEIMETPLHAATALVAAHPVDVNVTPALSARNRLTCAFRPILALPHLLLVGGPIALAVMVATRDDGMFDFGAGGGVLGAVAVVIAIIAWFAIVFGSKFPPQLWELSASYLRWRVRAVAYLVLLRDEYPPFGEGPYASTLTLPRPEEPRNRLTVAFRVVLAIPQIMVVWLLGVLWFFATLAAWFNILVTGSYPESLHHFSVGMLRWSTRVEAYLLLLRDEYPPFSLD